MRKRKLGKSNKLPSSLKVLVLKGEPLLPTIEKWGLVWYCVHVVTAFRPESLEATYTLKGTTNAIGRPDHRRTRSTQAATMR